MLLSRVFFQPPMIKTESGAAALRLVARGQQRDAGLYRWTRIIRFFSVTIQLISFLARSSGLHHLVGVS